MIQNIIQIMAQVLCFWRRGAKGDAESALLPPRPGFEKLLQAVRNGEVDVVYVYGGARSPREFRMTQSDERCGSPQRCSAMEDIAKSNAFRASGAGIGQPIAEHADSELPVAIYCRNATRHPEDSTLDAQVAACVEQAEADGERVDPLYVYREWGSGLNFDRALLGRLREAVQAGKVRAVYVYSPYRLSRNFRHLVLLGEEFASAGVELRFVQGAVNVASSLVCALDEYYRRSLAEPSEKGVAGGEVVNSVERMFELASAGESCAQIADRLNRMGLPSESIAGWNTSTVRQYLERWFEEQKSTD